MRNQLGWIAGAVGAAGVVAYRFVRRRPAPDARADELRRKLDESRAVDDREEFEAAETRVDEAIATGLDDRRRDVHERARAAVDEMRRREP
jgi:hypothetical protein